MKHKEIIDKINKHVFENSALPYYVVLHTSECSECNEYLLKSEKLLKGIEKIKQKKNEISTRIQVKSYDLIETKFLPLMLIIRNFKVAITLGIVLIMLIIGIAGYILLNSNEDFISYDNKVKEEFSLMIQHANYIYSFDEITLSKE